MTPTNQGLCQGVKYIYIWTKKTEQTKAFDDDQACSDSDRSGPFLESSQGAPEITAKVNSQQFFPEYLVLNTYVSLWVSSIRKIWNAVTVWLKCVDELVQDDGKIRNMSVITCHISSYTLNTTVNLDLMKVQQCPGPICISRLQIMGSIKRWMEECQSVIEWVIEWVLKQDREIQSGRSQTLAFRRSYIIF